MNGVKWGVAASSITGLGAHKIPSTDANGKLRTDNNIDYDGTDFTIGVPGDITLGAALDIDIIADDVLVSGSTTVTLDQGTASVALVSDDVVITPPITSEAEVVVLNVNTTSVGNVGAGTDNLMSYTLPADTMDTDLQSVTIEAWGTVANNANNKTINLLFGAQSLLSITEAANNNSWYMRAVVVRKTVNTQESETFIVCPDDWTVTFPTQHRTPAETLSGAVVIKATGAATADNDIVQTGMRVTWYKEP